MSGGKEKYEGIFTVFFGHMVKNAYLSGWF